MPKILINLVLNNATRFYKPFNDLKSSIKQNGIDVDVNILTNLEIPKDEDVKIYKKVGSISDVEFFHFLKSASAFITDQEISHSEEYAAVFVMHAKDMHLYHHVFSTDSLRNLCQKSFGHEIRFLKHQSDSIKIFEHFKSKSFVMTPGTFRNVMNCSKIVKTDMKNLNAFLATIILRIGIAEVSI
jgi:hypothetical protein